MKRILLILTLILMISMNAFGLSGTYTSNSFFYLPGYGSYGTDEFAAYNAYMEIADNAIKDNETAIASILSTSLPLYYLKTEINTQAKIEAIWGVTLANDDEIRTDEEIEDLAGGLFTGNTETLVTVTYQGADNTIDVVVDDNLDDYDNTYSEFLIPSDMSTYCETTQDYLKTSEEVDWTTDQGVVNIHAGNYTDTDTTYTGTANEITLTGTTFSLHSDIARDSELHTIATINATANGLSLSGQEIALGLASTSTIGALSDTDWDTFNNKVSFPGFTSLSDDYSFTDNSTNWNTAYGWGDWSGANSGITSLTGLTTALSFAQGGTGLASWTQYLIPYAGTTTSISQIAIGTDGQVLTSGGAGVAPSFEDASGYTNLTSFVDQNTFKVFYSNTSGDVTELALGADNTYLMSNGADQAPTFETASDADTFAGFEIDGESQTSVAPTFDFDGTTFVL